MFNLSLLFNILTWWTQGHLKLRKPHITTFDCLISLPNRGDSQPSRCLSQKPGKCPWRLPFHQQVLSAWLPKDISNLTSLCVFILTWDTPPAPTPLRVTVSPSLLLCSLLLGHWADNSVSLQQPDDFFSNLFQVLSSSYLKPFSVSPWHLEQNPPTPSFSLDPWSAPSCSCLGHVYLGLFALTLPSARTLLVLNFPVSCVLTCHLLRDSLSLPNLNSLPTSLLNSHHRNCYYQTFPYEFVCLLPTYPQLGWKICKKRDSDLFQVVSSTPEQGLTTALTDTWMNGGGVVDHAPECRVSFRPSSPSAVPRVCFLFP